MQSNQVGFESSFQQHLDAEQRRAVLEAIGEKINPDSTLGEIIDAAQALGWSEKMGDLSLADLAEALLAPPRDGSTITTLGAADIDSLDEDDELDDDELDDLDDEDLDDEDLDEDDELDDNDDEFELVIQESSAARRTAAPAQINVAASKKAASKKAASKKAPSKKAASKKAASKKAASKKAPSKKAASKKAASKKVASKKAPSKKAAPPAPVSKQGKRKLTAVDVDDRMSLEQAAEFFLPYVKGLGEATMQALEEQTGVSRRKLRFHVGQLVKHGLLERHGMGRGTYYTEV